LARPCARICGPDCGANQSRAAIAGARRPLDWFAVFLLGSAVLINDNAASKAALFWPKMILLPKGRIRGTAPDHDQA
jgi:hypothetical protein